MTTTKPGEYRVTCECGVAWTSKTKGSVRRNTLAHRRICNKKMHIRRAPQTKMIFDRDMMGMQILRVVPCSTT